MAKDFCRAGLGVVVEVDVGGFAGATRLRQRERVVGLEVFRVLVNLLLRQTMVCSAGDGLAAVLGVVDVCASDVTAVRMANTATVSFFITHLVAPHSRRW